MAMSKREKELTEARDAAKARYEAILARDGQATEEAKRLHEEADTACSVAYHAREDYTRAALVERGLLAPNDSNGDRPSPAVGRANYSYRWNAPYSDRLLNEVASVCGFQYTDSRKLAPANFRDTTDGPWEETLCAVMSRAERLIWKTPEFKALSQAFEDATRASEKACSYRHQMMKAIESASGEMYRAEAALRDLLNARAVRQFNKTDKPTDSDRELETKLRKARQVLAKIASGEIKLPVEE